MRKTTCYFLQDLTAIFYTSYYEYLKIYSSMGNILLLPPAIL